jgi:8-oxo-dGTP pyrophosphatase MutT (NUDIX family)
MTTTQNTPLPASTLIIARENRGKIEVFMVVRHQQIDFASGALVFPGGKVDSQDADPALIDYLDGPSEDTATRSIQVAGIRETFEECGILLARDRTTSQLISGERLRKLTGYRESLHSGEITLKGFLEREQLHFACDQLEYFANWVTPEFKRRRFDTHFFLARTPDDHFAEHDGMESVDSVWITPKQALADAQSGKRLVLFPTICNLDRIGRYSSLDEAMADTRRSEVIAVSPWIEKREDGNYLRISDKAGYQITEEKIVRPL